MLSRELLKDLRKLTKYNDFISFYIFFCINSLEIKGRFVKKGKILVNPFFKQFKIM